MKAHLHKLLTRLAEHHIAKGGHHVELAKAHRQMADENEAHSAIADAHEEMAAEHAEMGKECVRCAKALHSAPANKAFGMSEADDELLPLPAGLSRIATETPNLRAIPRTGAPPIKQLDITDELREMFKIDGGEN